MKGHTPEWEHEEYLRCVLPTNELKKTAKKVSRVLLRYKFDSIAFRGMSVLCSPL